MPLKFFPAAMLALAANSAAQAQDLASTCHASSSYDLTLAPDALLFDRAAPTPQRVELHAGKLAVDGANVRINTEDSDRLALFEREVRTLLPKVRAVAQNGVDLALRAVRAETAELDLDAQSQADIERRLALHGAQLKQRIATSVSTHDWQGDAFDRYAEDIAADIVPLLAADLATQAVTTALGGDLDAASTLRDRAAQLPGDLRPRLERRMLALRPQIQSLCPSIQRLYDLQRDVRGANGRPLGLLQMERRK